MPYIVFGGGCFWGVESYFKQITGVTKTIVGYCGGNTKFPTYEDVCLGITNHAEVVKIEYDELKTNIKILLEHLFNIIDPTLQNQQGDDIGSQYRTGIYYTNILDKAIIYNYIESIKKNYRREIITEVKALDEFWEAEDIHQDYVKIYYLHLYILNLL